MFVTPLYAALLALIFISLSVETIRLRRRFKISIGDGGNPHLLRAMRVHANFAEYVPLSLILLYFAEVMAAPVVLLHLLGIALLLGRVIHAWGVSKTTENFKFRVSGMVITIGVIMITSLYILLSQFQ